ncbi:MAG: hypothetical protein K2P68_02015 [Sphingomonas sp.]|nr:hypothetical protein [Sphingomonas sp.]
MRGLFVVLGVVTLIIIAAISFGLVDISQTQTAKLPEMALKGGQAPAFHADVANVSIGTKTKTVALPTIAVTEHQIAVPTVKVTRPGDPVPPSAPARN